MIKTVVAVLVMLAAFLGGVPIAIVAIAGAAATLLTRRVNPNKVYREIDWKLLVLFTGLFVLTGGAERTGLADAITTSPLAAGLERPAVLTAVTAVLSNLVSNVPAVAGVKTLPSHPPQPPPARPPPPATRRRGQGGPGRQPGRGRGVSGPPRNSRWSARCR